jgi:hypothetical protein
MFGGEFPEGNFYRGIFTGEFLQGNFQRGIFRGESSSRGKFVDSIPTSNNDRLSHL